MLNKIIHIHFCGPYTEEYNYQENVLPKYHKKFFNEVEIWTTDYSWYRGKLKKVPLCDKLMEDGVRLIRFSRAFLFNKFFSNKMRLVFGIYDRLMDAKPDFIMLHGLQTLTVYQLVKFMKHNLNTKLIIDNHADCTNSATNWLSLNVLHKIFYKHLAKKIEPYVFKFYGVSPLRVDFLTNIYRLPREKCELLVMGADDEIVETAKSDSSICYIRDKYGIKKSDILIVTGGKLNNYRPEVLNLFKSVIKLNKSNLKLIFFGSVDSVYANEFNELCNEAPIINIGWIESKDAYMVLAAADLAVFPGLHSVLWEQAVGVGTPCIFKEITGFNHVQINGNCRFISDVSENGIRKELESILDGDILIEMKKNAEMAKTFFSYNEIARKSIKG